MKKTVIWSDAELGYGELKPAILAVVGGEVVKNENGTIGAEVDEPVYQEDESEIRIVFKKK